ncbi:MAG TPA: helix-turn-helix transcriptional regulator [Solirubrobacteraceae bacterium]|nr:helix-turn-helix transcriptional regulator [Solirubrobacteraceae bacterium]
MTEHGQQLVALGQIVRLEREERGMSAGELAGTAGIERGRLDAIEAGRIASDYDVLLALADGLCIEPAALVSRAERAGDLDPHAACVAPGRRLRELRTEHGVSQDGLARRTGINRTAIGKVEQGASDPRYTTVLRLARGLNVPPEGLVNKQIAAGDT